MTHLQFILFMNMEYPATNHPGRAEMGGIDHPPLEFMIGLPHSLPFLHVVCYPRLEAGGRRNFILAAQPRESMRERWHMMALATLPKAKALLKRVQKQNCKL